MKQNKCTLNTASAVIKLHDKIFNILVEGHNVRCHGADFRPYWDKAANLLGEAAGIYAFTRHYADLKHVSDIVTVEVPYCLNSDGQVSASDYDMKVQLDFVIRCLAFNAYPSATRDERDVVMVAAMNVFASHLWLIREQHAKVAA